MKKVRLFFILTFICYFFNSCKKDPIQQQQLNVSISPTSSGTVNQMSGSFAKGSTIKLTAIPNSEYIFKEWTGSINSTSNPLNLLMDADKNLTCVFEKRQYPLSLTIVGSGTVKEEVVKVASASTSYTSGTVVRLTPQPNDGYQFKGWTGDSISNSTPLDLTVTKPINLTCNFEKMEITSLKVDNLLDTIVISNKHKYIVKGVYSNGTTIDLSDSITLTTSSNNVTILSNKNIIGAKSGSSKIKIMYKSLSFEDDFYVNYFEEILNKSSDFLRVNNTSSNIINVPVVIINFHPTLDGISIDPRRYLDDYFIKDRFYNFYGVDRNTCSNPLSNSACQVGSLEMYKQRAQDIHSLTKFGIEEGSKFRNFNNNSSNKTVNIQVVKYFNFYEIKTKLYGSRDVPEPDYQDLFSKVNMETLVNNLGVKEVWICIPPLSTEYPNIQNGLISKEFLLNLPESNMSSPTGDVSNSSRFEGDLPKYNNTYVVYGVNIDRGPGEAIHNRGHQLESQLSFIEKDKQSMNELFWNKFVGMRASGGPLGRNGSTHFPPNTNIDYDYGNTNLISSDINNWIPSGGVKTNVNVDSWLKRNYTFPNNVFFSNKIDNLSNDTQYLWLLYWFQSFPNLNSNIPFTTNSGKSTVLTNWWDIFYNWDDARQKNKTLWVE